MSGVERTERRRVNSAVSGGLGDRTVAAIVAFVEIAAIVGCAVASGVLYHFAVYGAAGGVKGFAAVGLLSGVLYVLPFRGQGQGTESFLSGRRSSKLVIRRWAAAVLLLAVVGFLTKTTATFSRGWILILVACAPVVLMRLESIMGRLVLWGVRSGRLQPRGLMVVGTQSELDAFWSSRDPLDDGYRVLAVARIEDDLDATTEAGSAALTTALDRAVLDARALGVDCVLLLASVGRQQLLVRCLAAFSQLPVGVRLDAGAIAGLTGGRRVDRVGNVLALALLEQPGPRARAVLKRVFDIVAAAAGLIVLSPLFAAIAVAIKLDSAGPAFFRQRRRGYNQREFRIYKFRTMTTMDDGDVVPQAQRNDPRVTRVGRFLRRWNLDELPQLINVLAGEMSIVGPRPHAVAHDVLFEKRIAGYGRRLEVKPGMTGWAQVNGLRGETGTDDKMRQRVAYDLHYIDNWSLAFDLYIVVLTVSSPRAFANAH